MNRKLLELTNPKPGFYVIVPGCPDLTHRRDTLEAAEAQKKSIDKIGYRDVVIEIIGSAGEIADLNLRFGEGAYEDYGVENV